METPKCIGWSPVFSSSSSTVVVSLVDVPDAVCRLKPAGLVKPVVGLEAVGLPRGAVAAGMEMVGVAELRAPAGFAAAGAAALGAAGRASGTVAAGVVGGTGF